MTTGWASTSASAALAFAALRSLQAIAPPFAIEEVDVVMVVVPESLPAPAERRETEPRERAGIEEEFGEALGGRREGEGASGTEDPRDLGERSVEPVDVLHDAVRDDRGDARIRERDRLDVRRDQAAVRPRSLRETDLGEGRVEADDVDPAREQERAEDPIAAAEVEDRRRHRNRGEGAAFQRAPQRQRHGSLREVSAKDRVGRHERD